MTKEEFFFPPFVQLVRAKRIHARDPTKEEKYFPPFLQLVRAKRKHARGLTKGVKIFLLFSCKQLKDTKNKFVQLVRTN